MSEPPADDRRRTDRRGKPGQSRALVPAEPAPTPRAKPKAAPLPDPAFEAQRLGQPGQKRGLKGGQEVLAQARSTYLRSEYSGAAERRPRPGKTTRTEI